MKIHHFGSTGEAYDSVQCSEEIEDGDMLIIESENVIGIADTWPVAVTKESGKLHSFLKDAIIKEWAEDREIPLTCVAEAVTEANRRGWELAEQFKGA